MDILKKIRIDGIDYDIGASIEPADYANLGGIIIGSGLFTYKGKTDIYLETNSGLCFANQYNFGGQTGAIHSSLAIDTAWLIEFIKDNFNIGSTTNQLADLQISLGTDVIEQIFIRTGTEITFSIEIPSDNFYYTCPDCLSKDKQLLLAIGSDADGNFYNYNYSEMFKLGIFTEKDGGVTAYSIKDCENWGIVSLENDTVTLGSIIVVPLGTFFERFGDLSMIKLLYDKNDNDCDSTTTTTTSTIDPENNNGTTTTTTTTIDPEIIHRDMAFDLIINNDYTTCYNNTSYSNPCIDYVYVGTDTLGYFYFQPNDTAEENYRLTIPSINNANNDKRYIIVSMLPEIPTEFAEDSIYINSPKCDWYIKLSYFGISVKEYNDSYVHLGTNSYKSLHDYIAIDVEDLISRDLFLYNNGKFELELAGVCTRDTDVDITIERWGKGDYISNNLIDLISLGTLLPDNVMDSVYVVDKNDSNDIGLHKENVMLKYLVETSYKYQHINIAVQNNIPIEKIDEVINISINSSDSEYYHGGYSLGTCSLKSTKIPYRINTDENSSIQYGDKYRNRYVNIKLMDIIQTYGLTKDIHIRFCAFGDYEEEKNNACDESMCDSNCDSECDSIDCSSQSTVNISVVNWDNCDYEYSDLIDVISLGTYPYYYPQDKTYIKLKNSEEDDLFLTEEIIDNNEYPIYLKIAVQKNIPLEDVGKVIHLYIVSDDYELGTTAINQIPQFSYIIEQDFPPIEDDYGLSRTNYVSINLKELIDIYELKNPNLQFCGLSDQYETRHPFEGL